MKKLVNIRNSVIVILCITIICMGIGFIVLSIKLDSLNNVVNSYDVSFTKITKISSIKGNKSDPVGTLNIADNGKRLDMEFTMYSQYDELVYSITIKNQGTMTAEIIDLIESPEYSSGSFKNALLPVSVSITDVVGKVLEPGDETELKVSVIYNPSSLEGKKHFVYKLGLITESR